MPDLDDTLLPGLEAQAAEVAEVLHTLANERRLMILCCLSAWREASVSTLAQAVGLSQSAVSQHLSKMRRAGLVAFRRESQTIWYRILDPRAERLLASLNEIYCAASPPRAERVEQER